MVVTGTAPSQTVFGSRMNNRIDLNREDRDLSVAELVHRKLDTLTPAEAKAARFLLTNYPVVGLDSLGRFAEKAGVSHPTILRFIGKLGISGYPEFQEMLRSELDARLKSPLAKTNSGIGPVSAGGDFHETYTEALSNNVRLSVSSISHNEYEAVVGLLSDPGNRIMLLGGRFTDSIATQAFMVLRALRPNVEHVTGQPLAWSEYLLDVNEKCVLLVFDVRRYQPEVVAFAEEAARRAAKVVLVTDEWLSPIARTAQHVLVAHIEAPSIWDSLTPVSALVETLIAAVSNRSWERARTRLSDLEYIRSLFGGDGIQ